MAKILRKNSNQSYLSNVEVKSSGEYLDLKSSDLGSLMLAVKIAAGSGFNSVVYAEEHEDGDLLRLGKEVGGEIDLPKLKFTLLKKDFDLVQEVNFVDEGLAQTLEEIQEIPEIEAEYIPEAVEGEIPAPALIDEPVGGLVQEEEVVAPKEAPKKPRKKAKEVVVE